MEELSNHIRKNLSDISIDWAIENDELALTIDKENIIKLLTFLHDDIKCNFKILVDICGVDYLDRNNRFEIVYNLLSVKLNHRIRIKLSTNESEAVHSATSIYPTAGWLEREVWDMYGVRFAENNDLRRILTDYGFDGHPQRKDFPLSGFTQMTYCEKQKKVIYEPVKLEQEYRDFDFISPWEAEVKRSKA